MQHVWMKHMANGGWRRRRQGGSQKLNGNGYVCHFHFLFGGVGRMQGWNAAGSTITIFALFPRGIDDMMRYMS